MATPRIVRHGGVTLYDLEPSGDRLCEDAARGLTGPRKKLPPKYFYDERGARLFDEICALEVYYPTRTELSILRDNIGEITELLGSRTGLVEFGSGSGRKTILLLERLLEPAAYVPIDISRVQLVEFALSVAERFPALEVAPVCADYTTSFQLPPLSSQVQGVVAFFPGSTIGNFEPEEAERFLAGVGTICGPNGGLLIGVDLRKDPVVIEQAYDDPQGVTAAFNLNLLARINRDCGADFDLCAFRHHASFDEEQGRIEMQLISLRPQTVRLPARGDVVEIAFAMGEPITTEYSYKYTPREFEQLAAAAGWRVERQWTDDRRWFAVLLLRPA